MSMTSVLYDITVQCNMWYKCEIVVWESTVHKSAVELGLHFEWLDMMSGTDIAGGKLTAGVGRWEIAKFDGFFSEFFQKSDIAMFLGIWSKNLTLQNANGWLKSACKIHYLNYKDSNFISVVDSNDFSRFCILLWVCFSTFMNNVSYNYFMWKHHIKLCHSYEVHEPTNY